MELAKIIDDVFLLSDEIKKSDIYKSYFFALQKMENDSEYQKASQRYKSEQKKYIFSKKDEDLISLEKVKNELYGLDVVKNYRYHYQKIFIYMQKIKNTITKDILDNDDIYLLFEASKDASVK